MESSKLQQSINKYKHYTQKFNKRIEDFYELLKQYEEYLEGAKHDFKLQAEHALVTKDRTFEVVGYLCQMFFNLKKQAVSINRRIRDLTEVRELFAFIALLHFDCSVADIASELKKNRATIYHYCGNIIDKYDTYPAFREKMHEYFTPEQAEEMKAKFQSLKRKT